MSTAVAPASVVYDWYGQSVTINLKRCHQALCRTLLDLDLSASKRGATEEGSPATLAFAHKAKLNPSTIRNFFKGRNLRPTEVNMIITALGLHAADVLEAVE